MTRRYCGGVAALAALRVTTRTRRRLLSAIGAAAALGVEVLVVQAIAASRREYAAAESAPSVTGKFGDPHHPPLHIVMLGDSTAAGIGVTRVEDSVGGHLARLLANEKRYVTLSGVAVSGSRVGDLGPQVSRALLSHPDVAVLLIGSNDATHGTPPRQVRPALVGAIRRLRAAGVPVVIGTCPDLGAARAIARPLRDLLAAYGRLIADVEAEPVGTRVPSSSTWPRPPARCSAPNRRRRSPATGSTRAVPATTCGRGRSCPGSAAPRQSRSSPSRSNPTRAATARRNRPAPPRSPRPTPKPTPRALPFRAGSHRRAR